MLFIRHLFFSNERKDGSPSIEERRWGETLRSRGKGNYNQNTLCYKRIYFQLKRKKQKENLLTWVASTVYTSKTRWTYFWVFSSNINFVYSLCLPFLPRKRGLFCLETDRWPIYLHKLFYPVLLRQPYDHWESDLSFFSNIHRHSHSPKYKVLLEILPIILYYILLYLRNDTIILAYSLFQCIIVSIWWFLDGWG